MNNKKMNRKIKVLRLQLLFTIFSLAISLTAFTYVTFAWFTSNRQVFIKNANTTVGEQFKYTTSVYVDDVPAVDEVFNLENIFPGNINSRKLTLSITSQNATSFKARWFLDMALINSETPYIDATNNLYYYLGSQIQARIIEVPSENGNPVGEGEFLVNTSSVGVAKGQINAINYVPTISNFDLIDNLIIAPSQTVSVHIYFTFVDNGTDQSIYSTMRESMESRRRLALFISEI